MAKRRNQKRNLCLWCGNPGASKEDVVPLWVAKLYPESGWWNHEFAHPDYDDFQAKRAKGPSVISRKFCTTCNNEWMSRLEQAAKPILTELMHGRPVRLDREQQELVAFWICKTVLSFESMEPETRRFARAHLYTGLYAEQGPLDCCQVWLARRQGSSSVAWHRAHSLAREDSEIGGFGSSIAMGQMVAHVIWHPEGAEHLRLSRRLAGALTQIWPVRRDSRLLPPVQILEDGEELSWLAEDVVLGAELVPA